MIFALGFAVRGRRICKAGKKKLPALPRGSAATYSLSPEHGHDFFGLALRSRPWSTKTHVQLVADGFREISTAADEESTPPDKPTDTFDRRPVRVRSPR